MKRSNSTNRWPLEEKTNGTFSRLRVRIPLGLFQAVTRRQAFALGLDQGHGDGLGIGVDLDAEGVVNPALGAPPWLAVDDLDGARGLLAPNQVFGPARACGWPGR